MNTEKPTVSKTVAVVGGGLAGLAAAYSLQKSGFEVTVYEKQNNLGGKAGARSLNGTLEDHGYHIFPPWYVNTWALIEAAGASSNFVTVNDWHYIARHNTHRGTLHNPFNWRNFHRNMRARVLSIPDALVFMYAFISLAATKYSQRRHLDQVSPIAFLKTLAFGNEAVAAQFQDSALKGTAVPSYRISAMTLRNVARYWLGNSRWFFKMPKQDLQSSLVAPLEQLVATSGCVVHKGISVITFHSRPDGSICVFTGCGSHPPRCYDFLVLALPLEALWTLSSIAPPLQTLRHALSYLKAMPMSSLTVALKTRSPLIPQAHTTLLTSQFDLSFVDIAANGNCRFPHVLNVIASDTTLLAHLSDENARAAVLAELRQFLGSALDPENVEYVVYQSNNEAPFFLAEVGSWHYRPESHSGIPGLFFAGDLVRTHIDLPCMEGAVTSGLLAAKDICTATHKKCVVPVIRPRQAPIALLIVFQVALFISVLLVKAFTWLQPAKLRREE